MSQMTNSMHDLDSKKIVDMYLNKFLSTYLIAKEFNVSANTIQRILKKEGVKLR